MGMSVVRDKGGMGMQVVDICRAQSGFRELEKISSFMIPRSQHIFEGSRSRPILFGNGIGTSLEFCVVTW